MEPTLAHSVRLDDDGVHILDRRRFPFEHVWVRCASAAEVAKAITDMVTQSSGPYFAALGAMVLSARAAAKLPADAARAALAADAALVVAARPTIDHLAKAVAFVIDALDPEDLVGSARRGAAAGDEAYRAGCRALGAHSAALLADGARVLADGRVDVLLTAADRVAMDGHVVNKVGTLGLAVAAHAFGVPYLAQVRAPRPGRVDRHRHPDRAPRRRRRAPHPGRAHRERPGPRPLPGFRRDPVALRAHRGHRPGTVRARRA